MQDKFIEKGTHYTLKQGKLTLYETNCSCKDIKFHFKNYVITLMLNGQKTIKSENLKFEFFPGTLFIPEKNKINNVCIPHASFMNPTQCLVLEINPSFLNKAYEEILCSNFSKSVIKKENHLDVKDYFLSNDKLLIDAFRKLYHIQLNDQNPTKPLIDELIIKEMLFRLSISEGMMLLKQNFEESIEDDCIRKVIYHINHHLDKKLTIKELAGLAGFGQTTFFKLFKKSTGLTPVEFILKERVRQAKILIQKGNFNLKEVAFKTGFNSYEYFCSSFKKIEGINPSKILKTKIN